MLSYDSMRTKRENLHRGTALVLVLVMIALVAGFLSIGLFKSKVHENIVFNDMHKEIAENIARSAIDLTFLKIQREANRMPASFFDSLKNYLSVIRDVSDSDWFYSFRVPILESHFNTVSRTGDVRNMGKFISALDVASKLGLDPNKFLTKEYSLNDLPQLKKLLEDMGVADRVDVEIKARIDKYRPIYGEAGNIWATGMKPEEFVGNVLDIIFSVLKLPENIEIPVASIVANYIVDTMVDFIVSVVGGYLSASVKGVLDSALGSDALGSVIKDMVNNIKADPNMYEKFKDLADENAVKSKMKDVFNSFAGPLSGMLEEFMNKATNNFTKLITNMPVVKDYGFVKIPLKDLLEVIIGNFISTTFDISSLNFWGGFVVDKMGQLVIVAKVKYKLPSGKDMIVKTTATKDFKVVDVEAPASVYTMYIDGSMHSKWVPFMYHRGKFDVDVNDDEAKITYRSGEFYYNRRNVRTTVGKSLSDFNNPDTGSLILSNSKLNIEGILKEFLNGTWKSTISGEEAIEYWPGMIFVKTTGKTEVDTTYAEMPLFIGKDIVDFVPRLPAYFFGNNKWRLPSKVLGDMPPIDMQVPNFGIPNAPNGLPDFPFGWYSVVKIATNLTGGLDWLFNTKLRLFGEYALDFPLNFRVNGSEVFKKYTEIIGQGWPWFIILGFPIPGGCIYKVDGGKNEYTYDLLVDMLPKINERLSGKPAVEYLKDKYGKGKKFFEGVQTVTDALSKVAGEVVPGVKPLSVYLNEATYVYPDPESFFNDPSLRDKDGNIKLNGTVVVMVPNGKKMIFDESGGINILGAGKLIVAGDAVIKSDIRHPPYEEVEVEPGKRQKERKLFSIIVLGAVEFPNKVRVSIDEASLTALGGVDLGNGAEVYIGGNFVSVDLNPKRFKKDSVLKVQFKPEVTMSSFLSIVPYLSKYIPQRYLVVFKRGFTSYVVKRSYE